MDTISEIQQGLREIAKQIFELSGKLAESGALNNAEKVSINDLSIKEAKAKTAPICNLTLSKASSGSRQTYMRFLSAIAAGDENRLMLAYRIGVGSGSDWSLERLAAERFNINDTFPGEMANTLKELRNSLLMDSLVIAHTSGDANETALTLIADACDILNCSDEDIAIVTKVAASIVKNSRSKFSAITYKKAFPGLSHLIPKEWIEPRKVEYDRSDYSLSVEAGQWVEKDETVCTHDRLIYILGYRVSAPVSGVVHIDKSRQLYIYSPFFESEEK